MRPSSHTTMEATTSLPCKFDISKHSIRRGGFSRSSTSSTSFEIMAGDGIAARNRCRNESRADNISSLVRLLHVAIVLHHHGHLLVSRLEVYYIDRLALARGLFEFVVVGDLLRLHGRRRDCGLIPVHE